MHVLGSVSVLTSTWLITKAIGLWTWRLLCPLVSSCVSCTCLHLCSVHCWNVCWCSVSGLWRNINISFFLNKTSSVCVCVSNFLETRAVFSCQAPQRTADLPVQEIISIRTQSLVSEEKKVILRQDVGKTPWMSLAGQETPTGPRMWASPPGSYSWACTVW